MAAGVAVELFSVVFSEGVGEGRKLDEGRNFRKLKEAGRCNERQFVLERMPKKTKTKQRARVAFIHRAPNNPGFFDRGELRGTSRACSVTASN
jgi:hypothetical protein